VPLLRRRSRKKAMIPIKNASKFPRSCAVRPTDPITIDEERVALGRPFFVLDQSFANSSARWRPNVAVMFQTVAKIELSKMNQRLNPEFNTQEDVRSVRITRCRQQ
jgi:hypothetical protein